MVGTSHTADHSVNKAGGQRRTCSTCHQDPERGKWIEAEFMQLDKNDPYGIYGVPIKRPNVPHDAKIVDPIWTYSQKGSSIHKAIKCVNGKQLIQMGVKFGNTYAACTEKDCLRLFVMLLTFLGNVIEDGTVVSARIHANAETQIFIMVDDVY
jgi:hypothetical protein